MDWDFVDENGEYVHSLPCREGWIVEGICDACDIREPEYMFADDPIMTGDDFYEDTRS